MRTVISGSVEQTRALGADLARSACPGDVFALSGPLGAGKTEFVRGFVAQIAPEATVRSPSFTLVNVYEGGRLPVYHLISIAWGMLRSFLRSGWPSTCRLVGCA